MPDQTNPLYMMENGGSPSGHPRMTLYVDNAPFPSVDEAPYDPESIALIKSVRSGAGGELTAILQYVYQNSRASDNDPFANAILQIALVEMQHMDLLGDAIQALGGDPSFDDGQYYWQAGNVNYAQTLPDMLRADIEAERGAIAGYADAAAGTTNAQLRALFERIRLDEELHLRFFSEQLARVTAQEG